MSGYAFRDTTLDDLPSGTVVRVAGYGLGARLADCGRTGTVLDHPRSKGRAKVALDPGMGYDAEVRNIDPACLRVVGKK